jgi:hypothetical protein
VARAGAVEVDEGRTVAAGTSLPRGHVNVMVESGCQYRQSVRPLQCPSAHPEFGPRR